MARCRDRQGPPKLQEFDLASAGQKQKAGQAPTPKLKAAERVVLNKGFWKDFPWEQRTYYLRDSYIGWVNAINHVAIWQQQVPAGFVLGITSVVFRALLATGVFANDVVQARDWYLWAVARYYIEVENRPPYDRFTQTGLAAGFTPNFSGSSILNQEQAVPGVPFFVYARAGQSIGVYVEQNANPAGFVAPDHVGVEVRGLWIPEALFDRYNAEMER